MRVPSTGCW
uniref:Uncharacterized protein n=1 Tax=Arundo donax TaxID=35708 RepID=A0A0A9F5N4_ARUDO